MREIDLTSRSERCSGKQRVARPPHSYASEIQLRKERVSVPLY